MSQYAESESPEGAEAPEESQEASDAAFRDAIVHADDYDNVEPPEPEPKERREELLGKLEESAEQLGAHFEHSRAEAQQARQELAQRDSDDYADNHLAETLAELRGENEELWEDADYQPPEAAELASEMLAANPDRLGEFLQAWAEDDPEEANEWAAGLDAALEHRQRELWLEQQYVADAASQARVQEQGQVAHEMLSKELGRVAPAARERLIRTLDELAPHFGPQLQAVGAGDADMAGVARQMIMSAAELARAEDELAFRQGLHAEFFLDNYGNPISPTNTPPAPTLSLRESNLRPPLPSGLAKQEFFRQLTADPVRDFFDGVKANDANLKEWRKAEQAKLRAR